MTTLADKSLLSGVDNKPPMLEKHLYDSWKSRMELYMLNRPHGRMILASVEKGPLVWPSITMDGVTRLKEYTELTPAEAIQADCDIKAINIILQGLPTKIYALVSQHRIAKDLWEKIKLLMQGTSLTKQERECKLYDEFDKFTYNKGESLHEYYNTLCFQVIDDVAFDLRDALSAIFGLSELKVNCFLMDTSVALVVMSADSAVTYTSVHSEARSWSIPSEDPYEEAARQLSEDLVPAEDEAPTPPLPPFFLSPRIRPPHTRASMRQMRATAPSTYHSLLPSGTPPLLPIPLPALSTSRRADIPPGEADMRLGRGITTYYSQTWVRVTYQVDVCTRESSEFCTRHHDAQKDRAAVRAEIEVLRRERLAYEQEGMETCQALARSKAHYRALEA
ncbi:hypothetical protein Tco_0849928 [Tanacetum coccineum]